MKNKILGILVMTLLIATSLQVIGTENNQYENLKSKIITNPSNSPVWEDNFDSYPSYSSICGQGNWKCWEYDPIKSATVTPFISNSPPNSLLITHDSKVIQEFTSINSGCWVFETEIFIFENFDGTRSFQLFNTFNGWTDFHISTNLLIFNDRIFNTANNDSLYIIYNSFRPIRIEIDFDEDIQKIYYNHELLSETSWTDGYQPNGAKNLAAVVLSGGYMGTIDSVNYDDFELFRPIPLIAGDPTLLSWNNIIPGEIVIGKFSLWNHGDSGSKLDWMVTLWPTWGSEWTFTPSNGDNLEVWDIIDVDLTFKAPNKKNEQYSGLIKIVNVDDPSDFIEFYPTLETPRNKAINTPFLIWLHSHSNLFPILQLIFQRFDLQ